MNTFKRLAAIAATAIFAVGLSACSDDDESTTSTTVPTTVTSSATGTPAGVTLTGPVTDKGTTTATGDEIEIKAYDDYFLSTFIKVEPNKTYKVKLRNEGEHPHTFTAPTLNQDVALPPGANTEVSITTPATGFAEFICKPHADKGMRGAIFVS